MMKTESKYVAIWRTVKQIPKGKVATYGDVAKLSGLPGQQRLVGYALHNLPPDSKVPWQRVINAQGKISLRKRTGGYKRQKHLLEEEGVVFIDDAVDLEEFGIIQSLFKE